MVVHTHTCETCREPLDAAAMVNPTPPDHPYTWHPGCKPNNHCECPTPWDQPTELIIKTKVGRKTNTQKGEIAHAPGQDPRPMAERVLAANDMQLDTSGWHTELQGRAPTWTGTLVDGRSVVLTTPAGKTGGQHCTDCHQHFASPMVAQLHRADVRRPCTDPQLVRHVGTGRPLLKQDPDGVWVFDYLSRFRGGVPPMDQSAIWDLRLDDERRRKQAPPLRFFGPQGRARLVSSVPFVATGSA